jgi:hypothetical protein
LYRQVLARDPHQRDALMLYGLMLYGLMLADGFWAELARRRRVDIGPCPDPHPAVPDRATSGHSRSRAAL